MNDNQNRARHDKGERRAGEKVGGRFKASRSTEASGVGLLSAADPARREGLSQREAMARDNYASLTPAQRRARNEEYRDLASRVRKMRNRSWTHHNRVLDGREDIRQEAMIRMFVKGDGEGLSDLATQHVGLARTMLSQEVMKVMNNGQSSREAKGRQRLKELRHEVETARGRQLTRSEVRELADEVRLSFEPGTRPKADYFEHPYPEMNLSFNEEPESGETDMRRYIAYDQSFPMDEETPEAGDAFARAQERLDGKHEKRSESKENLWSVMREANPELPELTKPSMPATQARRVLTDLPDGVYGAADRFLDGRSAPQEEAAIFAPWGGPKAMSAAQQTAVAEKLAGNAQFSDRIWDSALSAASRRAHSERPQLDVIEEF